MKPGPKPGHGGRPRLPWYLKKRASNTIPAWEKAGFRSYDEFVTFANALRDFLGLEPLYRIDQRGKPCDS